MLEYNEHEVETLYSDKFMLIFYKNI